MKQDEPKVNCVFSETGRPVQQLILDSFSLYLKTILARNSGFPI